MVHEGACRRQSGGVRARLALKRALGQALGELGVEQAQTPALTLQALLDLPQTLLQARMLPVLEDGSLLVFEPLLLEPGPVADRCDERIVFLRDAVPQLLDLTRDAMRRG
jgi:hypothetical protein